AAPAARRQLYAAVNVAGELSPALTVSDLRLTLGDAPKGFGGGSATVAYTLSNSGNALVKPVERVSVSGPGGIGRNESAEAALPELLPGARLSRSVRLEGVPWLFKIKAEVRVRGMAAEAAAGAAEATAEAAAWAVPLAPVGAFLVLLAGVAAIPGLARARRRARARADAAQRGGPAWAGRGDLAEAGWDGSVGGERDGRDRHEEDAPDGAGQEDGGKPARQFDQGGEEP
ncbi:MAG: hypothetical protein LBL01_03110, partial [Bifidobacteriaceae bacterium]|nr:hypothetical protein [Bifidobacteriaceae bacterium]